MTTDVLSIEAPDIGENRTLTVIDRTLSTFIVAPHQEKYDSQSHPPVTTCIPFNYSQESKKKTKTCQENLEFQENIAMKHLHNDMCLFFIILVQHIYK